MHLNPVLLDEDKNYQNMLDIPWGFHDTTMPYNNSATKEVSLNVSKQQSVKRFFATSDQ